MTIKPKITGYKDGWRFEKDASKLEVKMVLTEHRPRLGVTLPLPLNSCITSVYLSLFELAPKSHVQEMHSVKTVQFFIYGF